MKAFGSVLTYFGGGSQRPDQDGNLAIANAHTEADEIREELSNIPTMGRSIDVEKVGETKKRSRESEASDGNRGSKKVQLDKRTKSLVPNYFEVPHDAQPINLHQVYEQEKDWTGGSQDHSSSRSKKMSYHQTAVRPTNTLGNASRQAVSYSRTRRTFSHTDSQDTLAKKKQYQSSELLHPVDDRHARRRPMQQVQGTAEESSVKRPKIEQAIISELHADPIVDLTEADEPQEQQESRYFKSGATGRESQRTVSSYQGSNKTTHTEVVRWNKQDPFGSHEQKRVDKRLTSGRRARGSNNNLAIFSSPSNPSHGWTSAEANVSAREGTVAAPFNIDVECSPPKTYREPSSRSFVQRIDLVPDRRSPSERPVIDLGRDMDKAANQYRERNSQRQRGDTSQGEPDDPCVASHYFTSKSLGNADHLHASNPPNQQSPAAIQHAPLSQSPPSPHHGNVPLRRQFVRDNGAHEPHSPQQRFTKLKDRMQTKEKETSLDDEDELQGPTTAMRRTHSPEKKGLSRNLVRDRPNDTLLNGHRSSYDLKPTNFKQSRSGATSIDKSSQSLPEKMNEDTAEQVQIQLRAIYCKASVACSEKLRLRWSSELPGFHLLQNEQPVLLPNSRREMVSITAPAVRHGWTSMKGDLRAILKGSSYASSNGHILLEFLDESSKRECHDYVSYLVKNDLQHNNVSVPTDFDVKFENLVEQQKEAYNRAKDSTSRSLIDIPDTERHKTQALQSRKRHSPEERIIYDTEIVASQPEQMHAKGARLTEPRRSTRSRNSVQKETTLPPQVVRWSHANSLPVWSHPLTYPTEGARRVTIDVDDIPRLDDEELLNDTLVNFSLRYIEHQIPEEQRGKVHFFNTYFFSALSNANSGRKMLNYEAVERWTKNIDLFSFPYIVVPINVSVHWFVIIICNLPNLRREFDGEVPCHGGTESDMKVDLKSSPELQSGGMDAISATDLPRSIAKESGSALMRDIFTFDSDGKIVEDDTIASGKSSAGGHIDQTVGKSPRKKGPKLRKYDPSAPCLITMDSLGMARQTELKFLKSYIAAEAQKKRAMHVDATQLQGMTAKGLPEQSNFCDCGLYLIAYIEEFAKNPDKFVEKVLQREMDKQNDFADFNPSLKREEIRNRILKLHAEQEKERIILKRAKAGSTNSEAQLLDNGLSDNIPAASPLKNTCDPRKAPRQASSSARSDSPEKVVIPTKSNDANVPGDNNDLEVFRPHGLGQPSHSPTPSDKEPNSTPPKVPQEESDDEMLDDISSSREVERPSTAEQDKRLDPRRTTNDGVMSDPNASERTKTTTYELRIDEDDTVKDIFPTDKRGRGSRPGNDNTWSSSSSDEPRKDDSGFADAHRASNSSRSPRVIINRM